MFDQLEAWQLKARAAWRRHVCALFGHQRRQLGGFVCGYCDWMHPALLCSLLEDLITTRAPLFSDKFWSEPYRVPLMFPNHALMPRKPAIFVDGA